MKIKKMYQGVVPENKILNTYSNSQTDVYSCDYSNKLNTYSTEEQKVGTWIDGRPMYRKVVKISNFAIKDGASYAHGIENIREILPMTCGRMLYSNNIPYYTYPLVAHSGAMMAATYTPTQIQWVGNDSWGTSHTHVFIIYYTKTTD